MHVSNVAEPPSLHPFLLTPGGSGGGGGGGGGGSTSVLKEDGQLLTAAGGWGGAGNAENCCAQGGAGGGEKGEDGGSPGFIAGEPLAAGIEAEEACTTGWCSASEVCTLEHVVFFMREEMCAVKGTCLWGISVAMRGVMRLLPPIPSSNKPRCSLCIPPPFT